jgi:phage protein D
MQTTTYVPDCDISLDGRPLPSILRSSLLAVRFDEALEGSSRIELQFADTTHSHLADYAGFEIDTPVELSLGYRPRALSRVFVGTVTGIEPNFPQGGMPTLTVSAQDASSRLQQGRKDRGFPHYLTDGAIAALVAAENGLLPHGDLAAAAIGGLGAFAEQPRYQYKQSDYELLRGIAREYGFDIWVDGPYLNIKYLLRGLPRPEIELRWGGSLLDFSPRTTSIGQIVTARVQVWIEALKTQLAVEVGWDGERLTVRVLPAMFAEQAQSVEATLTVPDLPVDSAVDAIRWVVGEMRRRLNTRTTATGSAVGDPRFRAGRTIGITGIGQRFGGGGFRLTSVAHTFDQGGYRTRFQVRQEVI